MKNISFFAVGIFFGIVMTKSEAISWFRIQEMFRFESFHMYGIIGTAVLLGALGLWLLKRFRVKTLRDTYVDYNPMKLSLPRHLLAGSVFGLGWALVGCCPGPMYVLLGAGYWIMLLVLLGAVAGTYAYAVVMKKLPH